MPRKNRPDDNGLVFSTDPSFRFEKEETAQETLPPEKQRLTVRLDRKQRAGKTVTLVDGFAGGDADREALGKKLKNVCGTGGSAKDGEIIIQGDQREKIMQWLKKNGYSGSRQV